MRKQLSKYLPTPESIIQSRWLGPFRHLLRHRALWHLDRYGMAKGAAVGLFIGSIPVLGHIFLILLATILLRVNVPAGVLASTVVNPFTFVPFFYFVYVVGAYISNALGLPLHTDLSGQVDLLEILKHWDTLAAADNSALWETYLVLWIGGIAVGAMLAALGYYGILLCWRMLTLRRWRQRRAG